MLFVIVIVIWLGVICGGVVMVGWCGVWVLVVLRIVVIGRLVCFGIVMRFDVEIWSVLVMWLS